VSRTVKQGVSRTVKQGVSRTVKQGVSRTIEHESNTPELLEDTALLS